jgi:hypothetical protein
VDDLDPSAAADVDRLRGALGDADATRLPALADAHQHLGPGIRISSARSTPSSVPPIRGGRRANNTAAPTLPEVDRRSVVQAAHSREAPRPVVRGDRLSFSDEPS